MIVLQIEIKQGDIVKVEGLDGYHKVISLQKLGTTTKLELFSFKTNSIKTILSPPYQVFPVATPIQLVKARNFDSSVKFDLFVEAHRLSLIHLYDPLASLSVTKIDALPHQIEAVYRKMLDAYEPNYLLADDAGLGKTIMAGMLIKELKLRGRVKRILIVVPAALQRTVWQKELLEKFGEKFDIFTSEFIYSHYGADPSKNPWKLHDQIITSMDFAKRQDILKKVAEAEWDLVIFDEAHKLSVRRKGRGGEYLTKRYKLAKALREKTRSILLLTATPHSGDSYAFYKLVSLVDPYLFASQEEVNKEKLGRIMIRRLKEDVIDFDGNKLFKEKKVKTLSVNFTEEEWELYEAVTNYVRHYFNLAKAARNRGLSFAMTILQKRMASSIEAIRKSLENRINRLKEVLEMDKSVEITKEDEKIWKKYLSTPDEVDEEEAERVRKKYEALTIAKNKEELKAEIEQLERLLKLANSIKEDSKARMLLEFVKDLHNKDIKEKVLIFTEYRDTLTYLKNLFEKNGYKVAYIYGGMNDDLRNKQERDFKEDENVKIMVCTDAAGEGLNLQFSCHIMVNYELPWNPNRLEQRIGRLHRYLQKNPVFVHNIFVEGTIESTVLSRLFSKVDAIEKELGRAYDVLGILMSGINLEKEIMEAISAKGVVEERIIKAEEKIEEIKRIIFQEIEGKSLIRDKLDLEPLRELLGKSREYAVNELDLERFVRRFFILYGGKIEPGVTPGVFSIELPKILSEDGRSTISLATFSKEVMKNVQGVEFIALGHPLFDKMLKICLDYEFGGRATIKLDPKGKEGVLFVFKGKVISSKGELRSERLLAIFYDKETDNFKEIDPSSIWSFEDIDDPSEIKIDGIDIDSIYARAEEIAINSMNALLKETMERVERDVNIKREDIIRYYDRRINESYKRISEYRKKLPVKDMDIAIRREQIRIKHLTEEMNEKLNSLEKERVLQSEVPELIAVALILPQWIVNKGVSQKEVSVIKKIEDEGMRVAMDYERACGRKPTDVHLEFRGYDILSEGVDQRRYIEVKSFATTGPIEMTSHEWSVGEKLGEDYWLYVIEHTLDPEKRKLYIIQNPTQTFLEIARQKPILQFKVVVEKWRDLVKAAVVA